MYWYEVTDLLFTVSERAVSRLQNVIKIFRNSSNRGKKIDPKVEGMILNLSRIFRRTTCRKLYEKVLAGDKSNFVVTLDEAMLGLHKCNRDRKIFYLRKGQDMPEDLVVSVVTTFFKVSWLLGQLRGEEPYL